MYTTQNFILISKLCEQYDNIMTAIYCVFGMLSITVCVCVCVIPAVLLHSGEPDEPNGFILATKIEILLFVCWWYEKWNSKLNKMWFELSLDTQDCMHQLGHYMCSNFTVCTLWFSHRSAGITV
jgi:hypothetical protein